MNDPDMIFMFFWVGGKGGQKSIFSLRRISEFYPLDFEWTFNIFLFILNLMTNSIMIFVDILKVIDKINLKAVLLVQIRSKCQYQNISMVRDLVSLIRLSGLVGSSRVLQSPF